MRDFIEECFDRYPRIISVCLCTCIIIIIYGAGIGSLLWLTKILPSEAEAGIPTGTSYRWKFILVDAGVYKGGEATTITFSIMRNSDSFWLDFNDNTFKTSGHTTISVNPTENTDNSTAKYYFYAWTTLPSSETGPEIYTGSWESTGATKARDMIDISYDRIIFYFGQ